MVSTSAAVAVKGWSLGLSVNNRDESGLFCRVLCFHITVSKVCTVFNSSTLKLKCLISVNKHYFLIVNCSLRICSL